MLKLALAASTLLAVAVLIALIGILGLWMKGVGSIAFPGLGVIVGTKLLLIALAAAEFSLVFVAAYLVRFLPLVRALTSAIEGIGG
ncbi:MAG TPA: hypothetical protein VN256_08630 [Pyrinomonadaceae bacterium]|nr:hypothetical protein [Pyrinomonadaceae bacterium]